MEVKVNSSKLIHVLVEVRKCAVKSFYSEQLVQKPLFSHYSATQ